MNDSKERANICLCNLQKSLNQEKLTLVINRLKNDVNMNSVWVELNKKIPNDAFKAYSCVIEVIIKEALYSPPELIKNRRNALNIADERNKNIQNKAKELATLLEKQQNICSTCDIYEGFSTRNCAANPVSLNELATIVAKAKSTPIYPWDRKAIESSREASRQDFVRVIYLRLQKAVDLGVLPNRFKLTCQSIANIANSALDLDEEPINTKAVEKTIRNMKKATT